LESLHVVFSVFEEKRVHSCGNRASQQSLLTKKAFLDISPGINGF
jgi:hypothetical protein